MFATAMLLALCSPDARAYESEPQDFDLADDVELYTGSELDSDWLPSGSPIAVRFQVVADGGAGAEMEGTADLTWPEGLNLGFTGDPDTGWMYVSAALSAVTSVKFDLYGWVWESEIDRRGVEVAGETEFAPFLLAGGADESATVDTTGASDEVLSYSLDVFAGVSVEFSADLTPQSTTTLSGIAFWVEDSHIENDGDTALVTPSGEASQDVTATFLADWQSDLALVLTPTVAVCIPIYGCFDVATFDIPLTLASEDLADPFPDLELSFPLPVVSTTVSSYDFGEVQVGQLAELRVPVSDLGAMNLEGEAGLLGSPYFEVFPEVILAAPGTDDGLIVTFSPETVGDFEGTLLISTNDPAVPELSIPITGTGIDPDGDQSFDSGPTDDVKIISSEVGCGCANGGARDGRSAGWLALGLAALLMRRRGAR